MDWIQKKQDNLLLSGVAPKVRTGGSATTGQAAPPHRNNHASILLYFSVQHSIAFLLHGARLSS